MVPALSRVVSACGIVCVRFPWLFYCAAFRVLPPSLIQPPDKGNRHLGALVSEGSNEGLYRGREGFSLALILFERNSNIIVNTIPFVSDSSTQPYSLVHGITEIESLLADTLTLCQGTALSLREITANFDNNQVRPSLSSG